MAQINLYKTSGSLVVKPKNGFIAMFADENEAIKFKDSSGTITNSLLTATSASYATTSSIATVSGYSEQNVAIYRSTSTTAANGVVTWTQQYSNLPSGLVTFTSNQTFQIASTRQFKMEWFIGYVPDTNYYTLSSQVFVTSTWQFLRGGMDYASVATGGGTNFGGGTYAVDLAGNNNIYRFIAGSSGLPVGCGLILTRLA